MKYTAFVIIILFLLVWFISLFVDLSELPDWIKWSIASVFFFMCLHLWHEAEHRDDNDEDEY